VDNALRLSGDPALGLQLGERLNLGAHAVLGQAFMTCRDLAEVMQLFQRYYHVLAPDLELTFHRDGERVRVHHRQAACRCTSASSASPPPCAIRSRACSATPLPPALRVSLRGAAARERYREVLGEDLHFNRPVARWSFPRSC
jgi:hypothetical protein